MFIEEHDKVEKRKSKRVAYREAIRYNLKSTNRFGGCLAYDLSEDGIRVSFNEFVPVNSEMILKMRLKGIERVIDLKGKVSWLQKLRYSDQFRIGVEFTNIDPVIKEEIHAYIQSNQS